MVYEVNDIEEAVELAHTLKAEERYNWFRGQVQEWAPHSSYFRVLTGGDRKKIEKSRRRVEMFFEWCGKVPELRYLQQPEHTDDIFAIIQHYGIPTHYIDFTTDPGVAGFFAADTANDSTNDFSLLTLPSLGMSTCLSQVPLSSRSYTLLQVS